MTGNKYKVWADNVQPLTIEADEIDLLDTGHTVFYNICFLENMQPVVPAKQIVAIFPDGYCSKLEVIGEDLRKEQQDRINKAYRKKEKKNKGLFATETKALSSSQFSDTFNDAQDKSVLVV